MMARAPQQSLPQQAGGSGGSGGWSDLKAAYRLLNNGRVGAGALGAAHRAQVRQAAGRHAVVLCVQDDTDLKAAKQPGRRHIQHTTLAVLPGGELLGVLDQRWFTRPTPAPDETRKQRMARWRESCVWSDAAQALGPSGVEARWLHVADRAADDLNFMDACVGQGHGFVIRARHDRRVQDARDKLWSRLGDAPVLGTLSVTVGEQRAGGRVTRRGREAQVQVRATRVTLDPPWNHPRPRNPRNPRAPRSHHVSASATPDPPEGSGGASRSVYALYLREPEAPPNTEPIDWMLLTSEPVNHFDDARRLVGYYQRRWVIEEWHRVLKEGCRLERSQLADADSLQRLAAIQSIIAVRLLQLRDLADTQTNGGTADDPHALRQAVPRIWITLIAALTDTPAEQLTPRLFWRTLALRGGWPGRTRDPRPGWQVIWRGWHDLSQMARGIELMQKHPDPMGCG